MTDTAAKRSSSIGVANVSVLAVIPDGTVHNADRQTVAHSYGGILATESSVWTCQSDVTTSWTCATDVTTTWTEN